MPKPRKPGKPITDDRSGQEVLSQRMIADLDDMIKALTKLRNIMVGDKDDPYPLDVDNEDHDSLKLAVKAFHKLIPEYMQQMLGWRR